MKLENKRSNRRRWLNFIDRITNTGLVINFEYIKGSDNQIADILSRIIKNKEYD